MTQQCVFRIRIRYINCWSNQGYFMVQQFYKMKFFLKMYLFFQNKMLYYCSTAAKRTFRLHELPPALRKEHLALKKLKHRILSFYHLQQPWLRTRCNCKNSSPKPEDLHVQTRPARQSPPGWSPVSPPRTRASEQYTSPPAKWIWRSSV